jgi:hypothetical protein
MQIIAKGFAAWGLSAAEKKLQRSTHPKLRILNPPPPSLTVPVHVAHYLFRATALLDYTEPGTDTGYKE